MSHIHQICAQLHMPFGRLHTKFHFCCPFFKGHQISKWQACFFWVFYGKKNECCAVIQYLKIKGWNPKVFHKDMSETHGENAPSHTIVKDSHQNFKEEETAFKITCVVKDLQAPWTKKWLPETDPVADRWLTSRLKATTLSILHSSVLHILTKELAMRKASARWVPKRLTDAQSM